MRMMAVDNAVVVIMNQHPAQSAFTTYRQFGVVTNRPDTVRAAAIFATDRSIQGHKPHDPPLGRVPGV